MKNLFTTVFLLIFSFVFGQNSLLWKIEGNDLKQPSYLFGTVHMICKDNFEMKEKLISAIDKTEQAYLEIDMGNPNFMSEMQANMMGDKTISSQISKEDSIYINEQLTTKFGAGLAAFDQMKPMIVMSLLMQGAFPCELTSFEEEIISKFKASNKTMGGLSTVKDQYAYLDRFIDTKEMVTTIKMLHTDEFKSTMQTISDLYQKEDINGLDKVMIKYSASNPDIYNILMVERNEKWIATIPSIIKDKSTLIAVGSAHLAGEKGLINLLKAKGYKVTPVLN